RSGPRQRRAEPARAQRAVAADGAALGTFSRGDHVRRDVRAAARADHFRGVAMTTEAELIERLRRHFPKAGDDAAIVGGDVITTDMLVEDVDFTMAIPLRYIARKSLAVNLSDLAAMGATPSHAVVALAIPPHVDAVQLVDAMAEAAKHHAIEIVGGDLSRGAKLVISVTAIGRAARPLLRSGAKAGDRVYV